MTSVNSLPSATVMVLKWERRGHSIANVPPAPRLARIAVSASVPMSQMLGEFHLLYTWLAALDAHTSLAFFPRDDTDTFLFDAYCLGMQVLLALHGTSGLRHVHNRTVPSLCSFMVRTQADRYEFP